jgi:hypothetical protein
MLTCISAFEHKADMIDTTSQAMKKNVYSLISLRYL